MVHGRRHIHMATWMENNGYEAIYSEKTIFMKRKGAEYINHGLFVDDMMHIYSNDAIKDEFLAFYKKDFGITGGNKMETFSTRLPCQRSFWAW